MISRIKIYEVIDRCAAEHNMSFRTIMERSRVSNIIQARKLAYSCLRFAGVSLPYIAEVMERDHTSVVHALDTITMDTRLHALGILDEMGIPYNYGDNYGFKNLKRGVVRKLPKFEKPKIYKKVPDYKNSRTILVEVTR